MQRTHFVKGIQQLHDALVESQIQSLLASMLKSQREGPNTSQVLTVLKEYSIRARQFNDAAHQLVHLLGLDELESPETWSQLIEQRDPSFVRRQHERVAVVTDYMPQVAALLQHGDRQTLEAAGLSPKEAGRLTVVVMEQEDRLSSPQRLSELFDGLEKLYEVCAVVAEDVDGDKLSVLNCESGRDKVFELVGTPEVINELKNLILSMWDRVVFFRDYDLSERIERVAESLFMHERIRTLEQNHTIGPEQAEILRRGLADGVKKFMEAGALIPEIKQRAQHDPRRLMSPEPKLLVSGASEAVAPQGLAPEHAAPPETTPSQAPPREAPTTEAPTTEATASAFPASSAGSSPASPEPSLGPESATPSPLGEMGTPPGADEPQEAPPESTQPPEPTEPPADTEEAANEHDGVQEVLKAIAERHESGEHAAGSEERAEPEPPTTEPVPPTSDAEEASPLEEAAQKPEDAEPSEHPSEDEDENSIKGLNRMFDRIGGKHLFGEADDTDSPSEEDENQNY